MAFGTTWRRRSQDDNPIPVIVLVVADGAEGNRLVKGRGVHRPAGPTDAERRHEDRRRTSTAPATPGAAEAHTWSTWRSRRGCGRLGADIVQRQGAHRVGVGRPVVVGQVEADHLDDVGHDHAAGLQRLGRVSVRWSLTLGGLSRAREQAGAGNERQEYEATEGEPRWRRHGERATSPHQGRYASRFWFQALWGGPCDQLPAPYGSISCNGVCTAHVCHVMVALLSATLIRRPVGAGDDTLHDGRGAPDQLL